MKPAVGFCSSLQITAIRGVNVEVKGGWTRTMWLENLVRTPYLAFRFNELRQERVYLTYLLLVYEVLCPFW